MSRVLVVGHAASFRMLYSLLFFRLGYDPTPIETYKAALNALIGVPENTLVFVNIPSSPDDALAFISTVRSDFPQIAVLACAQSRDDMLNLEARLPDGVRGCVYAPQSVDELKVCLQEAGVYSPHAE